MGHFALLDPDPQPWILEITFSSSAVGGILNNQPTLNEKFSSGDKVHFTDFFLGNKYGQKCVFTVTVYAKASYLSVQNITQRGRIKKTCTVLISDSLCTEVPKY